MDKYGGTALRNQISLLYIIRTRFNTNHKNFYADRTQVSAHYVIADDSVVQMLNDYMRAWHAGNGSWGKTLISTPLL
jgi:N-acetylmuramoyl-L-alanine amidase